MNKIFAFILVLLASTFVSAQVTVQMERDGGVYKVPCVVNGVKMKFIFDTGASTVSMSQSMAQFLLDGDYLSIDDIKGVGKSVLADGSIVNHAKIILRDVEIGGMHIHDIEAKVIEGQNAPLLLGQTAISELGRISIDGDRLIIHSADAELTEEQTEELNKQIDRLIDARSYEAAIECLLKMESAKGLSEYGLYNLCFCYRQSDLDDDCIRTCKRWLSEYESSGEIFYKLHIYSILGLSYYFGKEDYKSALPWFQKELDIRENYDLTHAFKSEYFENREDKKIMALTCQSVGNCYRELESYYQAEVYFKKAVKLSCEYLNATLRDVQKGKVHDDDLGNILYNYANCYYRQKKEDEGDEIMKLAALCDYQPAIDFCRKYNISYQVKSSILFDE